MEAIKVVNLSVNYDKTAVLWNISFSVPTGAIIGIIGPNGAGKSTLLKAMLNLTTPAAGLVTFLGLPLDQVRQKVAYIAQKASIDWDFPITGYELVLMGRYPLLSTFKKAGPIDHEKVQQALQTVEMQDLAHKPIHDLSGGQQQRLFVARALAQEASIFLLDEPFTGIDLSTEKALFKLFSQLKQEGKTVVIVHHDLITVKQMFDVVVMLNTYLIASGPTHEVMTPSNLSKTYGRKASLLEEAIALAQSQTTGL